ncbi:hypothetical protein, partial [Lysobacter sp. ESA13C]|uniref:hypothetical protein n=1 Tax=Lysobacter sp. ESA13C TaxID=2862676 RepID=UPI001CC17BF4
MRAAILTLAVLAVCGSARAAVEVDVIGPEFSMGWSLLSDDGRAVAGLFHATAFHWTRSQGRTDILTFPGLSSQDFELRAISGDGSVVLLNLPDSVSGLPDRRWAPALWTREGGIRVVDVPGYSAIAQDMSADGRIIAGQRLNSNFRREVFRWRSDRGVEVMPVAGDWQGYSLFDPGALSGDGRTVIGRASGNGVNPRVFVWQDGRAPFFIDAALGSALEAAVDVSHDGSRITGVIVTNSGERIQQAYVWDQAAGVRLLGLLPSMKGSLPTKISADGQVIVGETYGGPGGQRNVFRWSEQTGTLSIQQWLAGYGVEFAIDPTWAKVQGVNADGSVIAGLGFRDQIWIARVKGPNGGFLLDVEAYRRSLIDANQSLTLGLSGLANATLSGAHHRSLLDNGLASESDGSCAWVNAEAADYDESKTRIEQLEVGVCTD